MYADLAAMLDMLQMKRKARDGAEGELGVTLGTAEASESENEEVESGQGASGSDDRDAVYEGGLSSDDEEPQQKGKAGHAAYFGMQKRQADAQQADKEYEGLSLAEQEALALRMIQQ